MTEAIGSQDGSHSFGHSFWLLNPLEVTKWPLHHDLKWLRSELGITCSLTVFLHIQKHLFSFVHTQFFFLFFWLCTLLLGDLWFHNGRSNLSTPPGRFMWIWENKNCGNTVERPLGLLCVFLYVCVRMCACMCDEACLDMRVCQVAHKYTVQYSFRYLPTWRINAWTEPWHGANISETITLYSVDNC